MALQNIGQRNEAGIVTVGSPDVGVRNEAGLIEDLTLQQIGTQNAAGVIVMLGYGSAGDADNPRIRV